MPVTGTYILLVEGSINNGVDGSYSFNVVSQGNVPPIPFTGVPLTIGDLISGNLTNASTNSYIFTLGAETRVVMDNLTNSPSTQWSLEGPPGAVVNNEALNGSDSLNGSVIHLLPVGDYQLRVRRTSAGTSPYRFRLIDFDDATELTLGTPLVAALNPANSTAHYYFDATAGTKLFFDSLSRVSLPNLYWRLIDPLGTVLSAKAFTDFGPLTFTVGGRYTLLVEGYYLEAGDGSYELNAVPITDGVQTLTIGERTGRHVDQP